MAAGHSPMQQFEVHTLIPIHIGGLDLSFTNASLWMMLAILAASAFLVLGVKRDAIVPGRTQSMVELMYDFIERNTVGNVMGESGKKFFPFIFTLFIFIFFTNFLGLIPYSFTVTSHIIVTFALSMLVFLTVVIYGFVKNGPKFLKLFVPSGVPGYILPIVAPIEFISFMSRPISLSVRLFGNILAGHITLKVFTGFIVTMSSLGFLGILGSALPLIMAIALTGLEFLVGAVQAYVFAVLTCMYLNDAIHPSH